LNGLAGFGAGIIPKAIEDTVIDEVAAIVVGVEVPGEALLAGVAGAGQGLRPSLGPAERGQQQSRQDGDDGNHHQELKQGEGWLPQDRPGFHGGATMNPNRKVDQCVLGVCFGRGKSPSFLSRMAGMEESSKHQHPSSREQSIFKLQ